MEGPATHPIAVVPAAILDARFPEGLKTQWFDPEEQLPWVSGFYEISDHSAPAGAEYHRMAWYQKDEQTFYRLTGEPVSRQEHEHMLWRGCVQALGLRRRALLAH